MRKRHNIVILGFLLTITGLTACNPKTVYHHFEHTTADGWQREDTLYFAVPAITEAGSYNTTLEVRTNNSYPFRNLSLIVIKKKWPEGSMTCDTLACLINDEKGQPLGNGISEYVLPFSVSTETLQPGDSLSFSIYHRMRRETLPGIMDIGIRINKD